MNFFVPAANDPAHARALYDRMREHVSSAGHAVEPDRIFRLRLNRNGKGLNLAVGDSYHAVGGDPILAIFKAQTYFVVCTPRHDGVHGEPIQIDWDTVSTVETFDS